MSRDNLVLHGLKAFVLAGVLALTGCNRAAPPSSTGAANAPATTPEAFLGVLTTGTYPTDGCRVLKTGGMIYSGSIGRAPQPADDMEKGYAAQIGDEHSRIQDLKAEAIKDGFNVIIGYQYEVYGGFSGYGGSVINGYVGSGVYYRVARGTPVLVQCGK